MISRELQDTLSRLDRVDKLRIIQLLVNDLAAEESLASGATYEVWSPYDAPDAATTLLNMLKDEDG